jgi:16S rRNA processing protein RimM|tara:strand:- start:669 stop:1184 length:516 start_codon:yes stop_codon:yes gene_type:complete
LSSRQLEEIIVMGKVLAPFGVNGWIKVYSFTEKLESFLTYKKLFISKDQRNWLEIEVKDIKLHGKTIIANFSEIVDRTQAEFYKDYLFGVPKNCLPPLKKNQYYWSDLIGCKVVNLQNIPFGLVDSFIETGANDVMVVKGDKERLIPYSRETVLEVDTINSKIIVDWDENF